MKIRILKVPKWHNDMVSQEAKRAKAAFEALSPEEQTALMQRAAQEDAMAQQAAQEQAITEQQQAQPSPEEVAIAEQQQADGSQAMVGQQPMMEEGGEINEYADGGYKKNAGSWKKGTSSENWSAYTRNGLRDYLLKVNDDLAEAETEEERKKIREDAIKTVNNIQKAYAEAYQEKLSPSERNTKVEALQKAFEDAGGNAYFSNIAQNINLPKGHNTADTEEKGWIDGYWGPRTSIRNWGSTEYGDADYYKDIADLAQEAGLTYAPGKYKYGNNTLYQLGLAPVEDGATRASNEEPEAVWNFGDATPEQLAEKPVVTSVKKEEENDRRIVPDLKKETSFGLFGPAIGLGLMATGLGKPDTSELFAAANRGGNYREAEWMPRGDFAVYRPDDPWFYTSPIMAQSNATQRAINNKVSPSKGAETLANSYNTIIGLGNAQRQALEHNFDKYMKVKQYNADIYKDNQREFGADSRFDASAYNDAARSTAQMQLNAAAQKMDADRWWASNLYGNINGLFDNINQWEKWKRDRNTVAKMYADGLAGTVTPETNVSKGLVKYGKSSAACGGKLKKGKKRGLTF